MHYCDIDSLERGRRTMTEAVRGGPLAITVLRHVVVGLIVAWCGGSLANAGDLEDLIKNVLNNERLYENIQFNAQESYTDFTPQVGVPFVAVRSSESSERYIYQGVNIFFQRNFTFINVNSKDRSAQNQTNIFDGHTTRLLNGNVINITDEPTDTTLWPHAHDLIFPGYIRMPFSAMCQGSTASKRIQGRNDLNVVPTVIGHEQLDGHDCIKLKIGMYRDGQNPAQVGSVRLIWVDTGRNFMPIRVICYSVNSSPEHARELTTVDSMVQLEPGVWFPEQVTRKTYEPESGFRDNKVNLLTITKYSKVELDPKNDPALFKDIAVAPDVTKYIMKDGKIIQTIPAPQPAGTVYRKGMSAGTKAGIIVAICLSVASAIFCYHQFTKRRQNTVAVPGS